MSALHMLSAAQLHLLLDVRACNVHLDVLHHEFAFRAVSCLHGSCIIPFCEIVEVATEQRWRLVAAAAVSVAAASMW